MSKPLHKENFPAQYSSLTRKLETLERSWSQGTILLEVNTAGLSNTEIDKIVIGGGGGEAPNGKLISDPVNKLILVRQEGVWCPEPPLPLPLATPWEKYESGDDEALYYKDPFGRVYIDGLIKLPEADSYVYNGENSVITSSLPEIYRPTKALFFTQFVQTHTVVQMIVIRVSAVGEIRIVQAAAQGENSGTVSYLSLAGINFRARYG